jgi:outer membrane protein OmpA-like peptidoglycan-associated protein
MSGKASGGRTAFLLDVSNSTRGTGRPGSAPDYAGALAEPIAQAVDRLDAVSIAPFSGRVSDLAWAVRDLSTDYTTGNDNPDNQKDRRDEALACMAKSISDAQSAAPVAAGTDVLGAMGSATDWLLGGSGTKSLIVATDGLVTTGCADLTRSAFASPREVKTITLLCAQRGEIDRTALAGVQVTLVGIGRPSSDQPVPTPQQADWLKTLWRSLCGAGCALSDSPVAGGGSDRRMAKARDVQDPPVSFQRGKQVYAMPSRLLFDTDSAILKPEALPMLEDIAVSIRTTDYAHVDVNGYADPRGDAARNRALSLRRAESVVQALGPGLGGRPHGMGATRNCPYAMALSEPADGDDVPCARRVEIVVTTKDGR